MYKLLGILCILFLKGICNYSLSDYSKIAIRQIGVYFSRKKVTSRTKHELELSPQVKSNGNFIVNKDNWQPIICVYKAKGDENYIIIGNFQSDKDLSWIKLEGAIEEKVPFTIGAYYYIDDVSLVPVSSEAECSCNEADKETTKLQEENIFENVEEGKTIVLKNIYFEFDKAELLPESYPALDMLYIALQENPLMEIEIAGHTDSIGTQQYNLELSIKRAESVVNYLLNKGISPSRLTYKGYGNLYPVSDNNIGEGRALNRRVEITIKKK